MAQPDLQRDVHAWVQEGIIDETQAQRILERQRTQVDDDHSAHGWLAQILYAGAGLVLGAAVLAFLLLGLDLDGAQTMLLAGGLVLVAGGVAVHFLVRSTRGPLLADTLFIGSFVPLVASMVGEGVPAFALTVLAVTAVLLVWRHRSNALAFLAVLAFSMAAAAFFFDLFSESQSLAWTLLQAALLVGIVVVDRFVAKVDRTAPAIAGILALTVAFTVLMFEFGPFSEEWPAQALLGLAMLAIMGAGIALSHKGLVVGSVAVLAGDAIWFGFTIGGAFTGTFVLLAVAGLLVWQAEWLRGHLAA